MGVSGKSALRPVSDLTAVVDAIREGQLVPAAGWDQVVEVQHRAGGVN